MEISIRPIVSGYRCFKLKDVSEESLKKLIAWAKDNLDLDIEVSLTTDNKLYRSKSQNQVVATHATTQLRLRQSIYHRSEIVVEDNEPIYCVYARSYLCFYSYSDFHKEFVEEVN